MSRHEARLSWSRGGSGFGYEEYPRDHRWDFDGGPEVPATAGADFKGTAGRVDPEEAFVAAVASCHMLTFLAVASRRRLVVDRYEDAATGFLEKNADGKLAITRVVLRPKVTFAGEAPPAGEIARLHERAHEHCFIANSVRSEVVVEGA